jgi:hypothetical protein
MGGDPFAFPTIVGGGGGRWFPFPTEFGLQHPFIFLKEKKKEDTFPAPAWVHLHLCFSLSLKKKTQSWDEDKASSSLSDLFLRLYLTPPLTFWRRRLGNNDLHRKRDGHHSDFPTVVEAESGKRKAHFYLRYLQCPPLHNIARRKPKERGTLATKELS